MYCPVRAWGGGPFLPLSLRTEVRGGDGSYGNAVWGAENASLQRGIPEAGVSLPKGTGRGDGVGAVTVRTPLCPRSSTVPFLRCVAVEMVLKRINALGFDYFSEILRPSEPFAAD